MATSVAEQLVEELRDSEVQRIYGLVGDSLNPIVDAVRRTEAIGWVHVHNEEAAAFAVAEVRLTGRLAVCAGSCGLGSSRPHLNRSVLLGLRSLRPGSL
jgi:pyruvate dehydrogenase (quinone)